jgi:hypothetical protein
MTADAQVRASQRCRYMTLETIATFCDDATVSLPAMAD